MCCGVSRAPKMKAGRQASVFLSSHLVAASWELAWETMSLRLLISRIVSSRTSMTFLFLTVSGSIVRRTSILFFLSNDPKKERKKERRRQVSVDDEEREDDFASVARAHLLLISFLRFFSDRAAAVEVGLSAFATPPPRTLLTGSFPPAKDLAAGVCATTGFDASTTMPS